MPDFNAPGASAFNAGLESPFGVRTRDIFDGTFTVRFWYKPTNLNYLGVPVGTTNGQNTIFQRRIVSGGPPDPDYWEIFSRSPSTVPDEVVMRVRTGGATYDRIGIVTNNAWNHVVVGYLKQAGTDSGHIFTQINGGARNFVETPPMVPMPTADGYEFGLHPPGFRIVNQAFTSYIDEVAIWRGYNLTEAEAIADRNGGTGVGLSGTVHQDTLLAYWNTDAFFTTTPFKTLRDEINAHDLVANLPYSISVPPGDGYPNGTGEIVAGKIANAIEIWGEWNIVGATSDRASSYLLAADPDDQFDFGVEPS